MTYAADIANQEADHARAVRAEHESHPEDYVSISGMLHDRDDVPDRCDA